MSENRPSFATTPPYLTRFLEELSTHAADSLTRDASGEYARSVALKALEATGVISSQTGAVEGVVGTWMDYVQPIAETVFGEDFASRTVAELDEYSPTVFGGISARLHVISRDEALGPMMSLDIASDEYLATQNMNTVH